MFFKTPKRSAAEEEPESTAVVVQEDIEGGDAYETIKTSTNPAQAAVLMDPTYAGVWESNGPSGTHWIQIDMKPGVLVTEINMIARTHDSYRPARLHVQVASSPDDAFTKLETIVCAQARVGDTIPVLGRCEEFYGAIKIGIEADGINCRINGIYVSGRTAVQKTAKKKPNPYADFMLQREAIVGKAPEVRTNDFSNLIRQLLALVTNMASEE